MMFFSYFATAWRQLIKNTGRSVLTMLGIIIGIGSVIFIMSTGEVAKNFLLGQISQFGTNVIEVAPNGAYGPFGGSQALQLTESDREAIEASSLLPEVTAIAGGYTSPQTLEYEDQSQTVSLYGDREAFFEVNNLTVTKGRSFTTADVENEARVVVLPDEFATDFFGTTDVIGKRVKIGGVFFRIIGLTQDIGAASFGSPQLVYAPVTTVKQLFADAADFDSVSFLLIEFEQGANVDSLVNRIEYVLNREHQLLESEETNFLIVSREQGLSIFNNVLIGIQAFVSAVAAISLMVGGIGIMNIMLVTVNERTKEIGLRKAIGAKNSSVLFQFLIESIVLTTVGGVVGIALGLGLTNGAVLLANVLKPDWAITFVFVPNALFIACGVAVVVGLIFGLYPAVKASKLHPIEALRYE